MQRSAGNFSLSDQPRDLGLSCNPAGLTLAGVSFLHHEDAGFRPRSPAEVNWLMRSAYNRFIPAAPLEAGLTAVATALNEGQVGRAMIGALLLRLPDLDWAGAARIAQADDALKKYDPDEPRDSRGRWTSNDWLQLPPGSRIDELGDLLEWIANAEPQDAPIIRSEIKRYYYDVGDIRGGNALNEALSNIVYGEPTREERQDVLDTFDMYTRADPAEIGQFGRDLLVLGLIPPVEAAADLIETADQNLYVWDKGWSARGLHIERVLGGNLPPGFPVIDRLADGAITSIKSIDLRAASYQNAARLESRINRYVDSVANFDEDQLDEFQADDKTIRSRTLNIAVPDGSITRTQQAAIKAATDRAKMLDVDIVITPF